MSVAGEVEGDPEAERASLSPSRVMDFRTCALKYRYRSVDRLPEPPSAMAVRGTLVHRVLELLYDLPATERTPGRADALVPTAWGELLEAEPEIAELFTGDGPSLPDWLDSCRAALAVYFSLEDPRLLEPESRELHVETVLDSGLLLRGYVDRLDVAPDGSIRIVDYKTGRSPTPGFEGAALFQLRFYALVLWRTRGVLPALLQLLYLGDGQVVRHSPDEDELLATERMVEAVGEAVALATATGDWQPNPGPACRWCAFAEICPATSVSGRTRGAAPAVP